MIQTDYNTLIEDFDKINDLADSINEPILITKNNDAVGVYLSVNAFTAKEELLLLYKKLLSSQESLIKKEDLLSIDEVRKLLR